LLVEDSMDRIMGLVEVVKGRVSDGSVELQGKFDEKYRIFLMNELEKINKEQNESKPELDDDSDPSFY